MTPPQPTVDELKQGEVCAFTVEYQTPNGDWRLAMAGRKWKTEAGALRAMLKWQRDMADEFSCETIARVLPLAESYNVRGVASLVSA